jgi:hypothetical protein
MKEKEFLQLKALNIYRITYWEEAWKYHWTITFSNEERDEFTFNVKDEEMTKFILIILKQIEKTAETFTEKLKNLFNIKN